ncbi:DUF3127 domain-containing protein [Polaribacter atrinae]|uniref:DUF3127 domain-containing protein n=1 Tax=Polaribacter atrinae TaxID=1333662 RepID=UPI00249231FC|nr:DUF3127 domain-containing protein [Polaribacter atrinae]
MEVIGKVKLIGDVQTFGSNGFQKRELVVTTDDQYPQMINIEFQQDKTDLLNNYKVGQDVKVSINLRGREWINPQGEAKYFNSIVGWRIENLSQAPAGGNIPSPDNFEPASKVTDEEPDDLPF